MNQSGFIITIARNGLAYTKKCLAALEKQTTPCEVLVIDNDSTDGTGTWLRAQMARSILIHQSAYDTPHSVSELWNEGLDYAWRHGYREALVVGNDTQPPPDAYQVLEFHMRRTGAGLVTGVSLEPGQEQPQGLRGELMERPHPDYSCFMISKQAHQRVRFDERYVGAYLEDCDHHIRLHRAGIRAVGLSLEIPHDHSATLRHADAREKKRIGENQALNRERFLKEYGCLPWTQNYELLFGPQNFGVKSMVAR